MEAIAERLDVKLSMWKPEVSREVRAVVSDVIDAADNDALDLLRSRAIEQEVLDQLDAVPFARTFDSSSRFSDAFYTDPTLALATVSHPGELAAGFP